MSSYSYAEDMSFSAQIKIITFGLNGNDNQLTNNRSSGDTLGSPDRYCGWYEANEIAISPFESDSVSASHPGGSSRALRRAVWNDSKYAVDLWRRWFLH
jgi:hypothetical protein